MPRSLARSSSRSVSGVAARSAAQSSRPIVRNRLPASITPATLRSPVPALQSPRRTASGGAPTRHRPWFVDLVVAEAVTVPRPGADVVVVDPACGDGRFLAAAARRVRELGGRPVLVGVDIDERQPGGRRARPGRRGCLVAPRPTRWPWAWPRRVDVVVGNPPYLSQLAATTTRGGSSAPRRRAVRRRRRRVPRPRRAHAAGRAVGSGSSCRSRSWRRATPPAVRAAVDERAGIVWSWWSPDPVFDAQVLVCAARGRGRRRRRPAAGPTSSRAPSACRPCRRSPAPARSASGPG